MAKKNERLLKEIEMQRREKEKLDKIIQDLNAKLREANINVAELSEMIKKIKEQGVQEDLTRSQGEGDIEKPSSPFDKNQADLSNLNMDPSTEIDFKELCRRWESANMNDNIRAILLLKVQ